MRRYREFLGLLVSVLAMLTTLAHASPPDQTWVPGVYDGGDFDDVVVLVTSAVGTVDLSPLDGLVLRPAAGGRELNPRRDDALLASTPLPSSTRGPPAVEPALALS